MCYKPRDIFKCLLELIKLGAGTFRCFSLAHPREGYLGASSGAQSLRIKKRSEPPIGLDHRWASSDYSVMSQHKSPALSSDTCCQRKQRLGLQTQKREPRERQVRSCVRLPVLSLPHLLGFFCPLAGGLPSEKLPLPDATRLAICF